MPRSEVVNKQLREEQRANILNAARIVFSRQGPAATIDDIARQANVSHGLAYRYFPNKDSLFQALVEEAMQVAPAGLQYFGQPGGHAGDRLALLISGIIERRRERPEFYLLLDHVRNSPATPEKLRNRIQRQKEAFVALLRSLIVEAQRRGAVPADDPDSLVMAISAFLEGLGSIALHNPEGFKKWCPAPEILLRIVMPQGREKAMIEVLIVGAGPVGLSLAIDLLRRGVTCRVIERAPAFAVGTRARGVSARTQEIFESMGVLSALRQYAEPNLPTRFYDRENRLVREAPASMPVAASPDIPFPNALMVSQENTDAVLRRRLCELGGKVEMDCALSALTQDNAGVTAGLIRSGNSETISARYVVGCDGGASTVRKCVGIQFMGETWEDAANYVIANLSVTGVEQTHWHVWTDSEWGYVTLQPVIHGHTWLFVATVPAQDVAKFAAPTAQSLQRLFEARLPNPKVAFQNMTWHSLYRRNLRIVERYRSGRVFLVGDSAHVGVEHGMNIGIQDACNLSWKIAQVLRGAPEKLLDTYEEERQPIARRILDVTLNRDRNDAGGAAAARSIEGAVSGKESANDPTQLSVRYDASSLSCDFDCVTAIRAGDRAPDSPSLVLATGQRVRLFEIPDARKFTLLCFSDRPLSGFAGLKEVLTVHRITRQGAIADTERHAYRAYGVDTDALVLIRPDGYVAATAAHRPERESAMRQHLCLAIPAAARTL